MVKNKYGALLKGLLRCGPCECSHGATPTAPKGPSGTAITSACDAQKRGWDTCPTKSVPAGRDRAVRRRADQGHRQGPGRCAETLRASRGGKARRPWPSCRPKSARLERDLARHNAELRKSGRTGRRRKRRGELADIAGTHPPGRAAGHGGARADRWRSAGNWWTNARSRRRCRCSTRSGKR